jgi:hypothetical protein
VRLFSLVAVVALLVMGAIWALLTRQSFSLQSLILLAVVPALVATTCLTGWLLYRNLHATILAGFDRKLFALSTTVASGLDGDRLAELIETRDEQQTRRRYLEPLREILRTADVTYLYTFLLGGKKDIVYLIDASPGDDFCPIGYEEEVPRQNLEGLRGVVATGTPYISGIQEYGRYGLLKVAAAPVAGEGAAVRALAGVDVNITVIRDKTRLALFEILAVGLVTLFAAGLVSLGVSRRLTEPLAAVKGAALRVAAGAYGHRSGVREPREVRDLADAFDRVGATIEETLTTAVEQNAREREERRRTELIRRLARIGEGAAPGGSLAVAWPDERPECADASGGVERGRAALVWLAAPGTDALAEVGLRASIADIARRLLDRHGVDWTAIAAALGPLFKDRVRVFVHWDGTRGIARALVRRPTRALVVDAEGGRRAVEVSDGGEIRVPAGGSLVLSRPGADSDGWSEPVPLFALLTREGA